MDPVITQVMDVVRGGEGAVVDVILIKGEVEGGR